MKRIAYLLTALIVLTAPALRAQVNQPVYHTKTQFTAQTGIPIDWRPETRTGNRYTIAIHPYHLLKSGLKIDFEMELNDSYEWLQIGVMGYYTEHFSEESHYYSSEGWGNLASAYEPFHKLNGAGLSLAWKKMLAHRGVYVNAGLLYNYYHVQHEETRYLPFTEDGLTFYERKPVMARTNFHQPAAFANVGKHMAVTRNVFVDMFIGMGYMYSFYNGGPTRYNDYVAFGYRGLYFNGGFRIGVLWNRPGK